MGFNSVAHIVVIGGIDPSGGAGLVRDALTAEALGARVSLVGSAWTLQTVGGQASLEPRSPDDFGLALRQALAQASPPRAVKIGVIANPVLAATAADILNDWPSVPVVFDPVLGASAGGSLFSGSGAPLATDLGPLLRRTDLLTPNVAEALALAGPLDPMTALLTLGPRNVLIKGGHLQGPAVDHLNGAVGCHRFESPRFHPTHPQGPRGTGCALATAISIGLAQDLPLPEAISRAKSWLSEKIRDARMVGPELRL